MLPPSYLDAMPDAFVQLAQQVEDEILQDVARRIGKMGTLTETADWQLWRYQQTEAVRENVVKLLAKYSGKSEATIRRLLKEAATEAMEREDAIYYHYNLEPTPFEESAALNNLLNAGARQTCGTWRNLTATTANTVSGAFERTLDVAWGKVATGAFDYKTAVKQAVDSLADEMPEITYPSGHTDSLEVAARRAVLTGVNQTAGKLQEARMDEMNVEFVETSAHGGARPSHAEWQGRRFHRGGAVDYLGKHYPDFEQATGYGTGAGLCGWNCRHTFFAVFPELGDPPTWTEESLQELNARNIEYNGKLYTQYEVNQMQRARERNVRKWKKRYLAESAAGSDTTDSAVRLKAARQSLAEFAKATGGRVDSARVSVPKFGRSEASRANWTARGKSPGNSGTLLQKLNYSNNVSKTERESIEKELSILPQWQRDRAERLINKVVLVDKSEPGSGYDYPSRTLYVHPDRSAGDIIHEYGHALEISLKLIHNKKYLNVRASGIDVNNLSKIDDDDTTFMQQAWILNNPKFISRYQGRMYEHVGIIDDGKIVLDSLMDYFSEGYRAYYQTPDILKEKDPELYDFIGGLKDDEG